MTATTPTNATPRAPRIALAGISLESNAFAPISTEADFRARYYFEGQEILAQARRRHSAISSEMAAFVATLDATGPWEPVPAVVTDCPPWGPVDHAFFAATVDTIAARLRNDAPLDAVYVANHGAMVSTETPDPDGEMLARIRAAAGPGAAIVATLDLHANISERMVEAADVVVGYQTNPHVDMRERGEEAAHTVRAMLAGMRPRGVLVRLPLTPPSVTLLTASGPYGELIDYGQRRKREHGGAILNVSIFGGFVFGDTPKNGLAVVVTGREDEAPARALALEIAERAWSERARYTRRLASIEDAVALAQSNERPRTPVIFADAGDNPGGGGGGNTTWLLRALVEAGARGVLYGSFFDPELARAARDAGVGASIDAVFNSAGQTGFAKRFEVPAVVRAVHEGPIVGRRGDLRGTHPRPRADGGARDRGRGRHHRCGDQRTPPDRGSRLLRGARPRRGDRTHRVRQVPRSLSRRVRPLVRPGAGIRDRYPGTHRSRARPLRVEGTSSAGLSTGPGCRVDAAGEPCLVNDKRRRSRHEPSGRRSSGEPTTSLRTCHATAALPVCAQEGGDRLRVRDPAVVDVRLVVGHDVRLVVDVVHHHAGGLGEAGRRRIAHPVDSLEPGAISKVKPGNRVQRVVPALGPQQVVSAQTRQIGFQVLSGRLSGRPVRCLDGVERHLPAALPGRELSFLRRSGQPLAETRNRRKRGRTGAAAGSPPRAPAPPA